MLSVYRDTLFYEDFNMLKVIERFKEISVYEPVSLISYYKCSDEGIFIRLF